MSPSTQTLVRALAAWLADVCPDLRPELLTVRGQDRMRGRSIEVRLPLSVGFLAQDQGPDRRCTDDVLLILREAGRRLTTSEILAELERRNLLWGERTVKGVLAELVDQGTLTNDQRARPRGYSPA